MRALSTMVAAMLLGAPSMVSAAAERRENAVVFTLRDDAARSAMVTGTWCGWAYEGNATPDALRPLQMTRTAAGLWSVTIPDFPATEQQYRFIVDGQWRQDTDNPAKILNEHGEFNSLVPAAAEGSSAPERVALPEVVPALPAGSGALTVVVRDGLRGVALGRCFVVLERDGQRSVTTTSPGGTLDLRGIAPGKYSATVYRTGYEAPQPQTLAVPSDGRPVRAEFALQPNTPPTMDFCYWMNSPRRRFASGPVGRVEVMGEFNRWGSDSTVFLTDEDGDGLYRGRVDLPERVVESDYLFVVRWKDQAGAEQTTVGSDPDFDAATPDSVGDSHFRRFRRDRPVVAIESASLAGSGAEVIFSVAPATAPLPVEITVNGRTTRYQPGVLAPVAGRPGFFRAVLTSLPEGESSVLVRAVQPDGKAGSDGTALWRPPAPPADPEAWKARWTDASPSPVAGPPGWLPDAMIYHVLVRAFADSNGDGIGDFRGLEQRLDHIRELGFNTIKLMPVWDGPSSHGYTPYSLWRVEQDYGTDDDFRSLVRACHAKGIRILLDYNDTATSTIHPLLGPAVREPGHPLRDWIWWLSDTRYSSYTLSSDVTNGSWPQFNYHNPQVREHMVAMLRHWAGYGVDGFRFDSAERLQPPPNGDWFRIVRRELKRDYPDLMLVGEVYDARAGEWFDGRLDSAYDMAFHEALRGAAGGTRNAEELGRVIAESAELDPVGARFLRFLGNHDVDRSLTMFRGEKNRLRMAWAVLFTMPGVPALWYGDEFGMEGRGISAGNGNRHPMAWEDGDRELATFLTRLTRLRAGDPTLRNGGSCTVLPGPAPERVLIVERRSRAVPRTQDYTLLFHFAPSSEAQPVSGTLPGEWRLALAMEGAEASAAGGASTRWKLAPGSALILVRAAAEP